MIKNVNLEANSHQLPHFKSFDSRQFQAKFTTLLSDSKALVADLLARHSTYTWANLMQPIAEAEDKLYRYGSMLAHLNAVVHSDDLRATYDAYLPQLSDYTTKMGQNKKLYLAVQQIRQSDAYAALSQAQKKAIANQLQNFELSGIHLEHEKQNELVKLEQKHSQLTSQFSNNVLDATQAWSYLVEDAHDLSGLPKDTLAAAEKAAKALGKRGGLLTLDAPCYQAVMTHADARKLREKIYHAYTTRASDQGPQAGHWDNGPVVVEILKIRQEIAKLLGFEDYASLSLATKMVKVPQQAIDFLERLQDKAIVNAQIDHQKCVTYAQAYLGISDIQPWDQAYIREKMREHHHCVSQEQVRAYFPMPAVLKGLCHVLKQLFDLRFESLIEAELWHPDVLCFAVYKGSDLVSYIYLDLYARSNKREGAWMDDLQGRHQLASGETQTPIAILVCNFSPPQDQQPALLTHNEVETLFHEMGHALQHMLTTVGVSSVSGINGVPWDAVELPSQWLENWARAPESLVQISEHYLDKTPMPEEMLHRIIAARNFQSSFGLCKQLSYSLFDMKLHGKHTYTAIKQIIQLQEEVRQPLETAAIPKYNRFAHSFNHIF